MRVTQKRLHTAAWALLALGASSAVHAQARPGGGPAGANGQAPAAAAGADGGAPASEAVQATVRYEGGRRVYEAQTVIDVRGEIQRPYAFTLSGRSSLGYSYFEQAISFVNQILEAVRRAPF